MSDVFLHFLHDAVRTPFGEYGGSLAGTRPDGFAGRDLFGVSFSEPQPLVGARLIDRTVST